MCPIYTKVTSGDKIEMGNDTIRLDGVSAPLMGQLCDNPKLKIKEYNCGAEAYKYLVGLIERDKVKCIITEKHSKHEFSGVCRTEKYDLNKEMLKAGWVIALDNIDPEYLKLEAEARKKKLGIWQGDFMLPWQYELSIKEKRKNFVDY
jgi:endonuclease YncB( thermonuclease family)